MSRFIQFTHTSSEFEVVADLLATDGGEPLLSKFAGNSKEFLDIKGDDGYTNRQRLIQKLDSSIDYSSYSDDDLPLVLGVIFSVPKSKLETFSDAMLLSQNFGDDGNDGSKFNNFISETHRKLLELPNYRSLHKNSKVGNYIDFFPQITIFVWSRALGEVINISPFVYSCTTNSSDNATSFQISLPPIIGTIKGDKWAIDPSTMRDFGKEFNASSTLFKTNGELKENAFYFHNVISQNDLVFIQYETLEYEKNLRAKDSEKFTVEYSKLPKRIYDVIGSVDSNSILSDPASAEIGIQIVGRDLSKFLIDDGTYFFYEELLGNFFPDRPENTQLRARIYGQILELNAIGFRSIEDQIRIKLNLFYTTGYYKDTGIFDHWENRNRTITKNEEQLKLYKDNVENQKKIAVGVIETVRAQYGLTKEKGETKEAESIFEELVSRIENGTFADSGSSTINKSSLEYFDNKLYKRELLSSDSLGTGISSSKLTPGTAIGSAYSYVRIKQRDPEVISNDKVKDGIWQIFDIEVDPSVADVRLYDNKLHESQGSILAAIQSIAEPPFVEIFTDTYYDRFKLIARRQPFDAKYYNELVQDTVIDIEPEEVISTNLSFTDDEIYTWYYLIPNALGIPETERIAFVKPFTLPEYIDIWGSRPYNKTTNYAPFQNKKDNDANINLNRKQAFYDLKFMVDTTAYLPFARKGTIVINGNRIIKKKQAVRLKQTGEIFHVDTLQNTYSKGQGIDRVTILNVSHGLKEKYMNPSRELSYFNIVNTKINETDLRNFDSETEQKDSNFSFRITQNWGVNKDVFKFFLQRRQFS